MILAHLPTHFSTREPMAGLETLSDSGAAVNREAYHTPQPGKLYQISERPYRKAVFRSRQWPARSFVTIPYRRRTRTATRYKAGPFRLQLVTKPSLTKESALCKGLSKIFYQSDHKILLVMYFV